MSSRRFFVFVKVSTYVQSYIVSTVLIPYSPIFPVHRSEGTGIGFRVCNGPEHITLMSYCIVSLFYITSPLYMKTCLIYQAEFVLICALLPNFSLVFLYVCVYWSTTHLEFGDGSMNLPSFQIPLC